MRAWVDSGLVVLRCQDGGFTTQEFMGFNDEIEVL